MMKNQIMKKQRLQCCKDWVKDGGVKVNIGKKQKNRRLPFGYQIVDGVIVVHPKEGEAVQQIFSKYQQGYSYGQLAQWLAEGKVAYRDDDCGWNKNMVKRILEREEYCGINGYSQLIDSLQWEAVQLLKEKKASNRAVKTEWPKAFRAKLVCGYCGSHVHREKADKVMNWQCQQEGKTTKGYITDDVLREKLVEKQNQIIKHPALLDIEKEQPFQLSLAVMQMNNEILQEIKERKKADEEIAALIYQAAAERYQNCSALDHTYNTKILKNLYQQQTVLSEPDFELIEHSVKKIVLNPDETIQFLMINDKLV